MHIIQFLLESSFNIQNFPGEKHNPLKPNEYNCLIFISVQENESPKMGVKYTSHNIPGSMTVIFT